MANQTFQDYFSGVRMTTLAAAAVVKGTIPRVFPDAFYTPGPTKPPTDQVQFPSVTWSRAGARVIARNSPPRAVNLGNIQWMYATVFNMKEEMELQPDFLAALLSSPLPMVRDQAMMELNRRMITFNQRTDTTRTMMVHSLFANGKIWIGADGQVLATSSGAVITMDPAVPTGNKITKDGSGGTYNIGDFSSASTDISKALRALQSTVLRKSGRLMRNIAYGEDVPSFFLQNTTLKDYLFRNAGFNQTLVSSNDIPNGFLGYNWTPARLAYAEDASGTVTQTFPTNYLGVMPDPDNDWYEFIEGGTLTPRGIAGATEIRPDTTMEAMMGQFQTAYGKYSYGVVKSHPVVGVSMVQGDCAGPVLKAPTALMFGTVS